MKNVGQFSTDSQQSGKIQIAEEQYDPDKFNESLGPFEAEYFADLYEEYIEIVAACKELGNWWIKKFILVSNYETFEAEALKDHNENCPCGDPTNFRYILF